VADCTERKVNPAAALARWAIALTVVALVACGTVPLRDMEVAAGADAGPPVVIYVIKRSWHTDIGFDVADLRLPLASLRPMLPAASYFLFGFGDRHYFMHQGESIGTTIGAAWPGAGLVLMTGLTETPEQAFGAAGVTRLTLSARQARRLESFVWDTLATSNSAATALAAGPYDGSYYYASTTRYSGLHTCNTWTAEGLQAAGLPVHSFAVEFSGQVWRQVRKIQRQQNNSSGGDVLRATSPP
jgi:uncharacterized protein (TIGR02117 family)